MKKLYMILILMTYLYGCSNKETVVPMKIKLVIVENSETEIVAPIRVKKIPLYEKNIEYTGELPLTNYLFTNGKANIRKNPWIGAIKIDVTIPYEKIEVTKKVDGSSIRNNKIWYKVKHNGKIGYIHSSIAFKREFRFEEMAKKARNLELFIQESKINNWSIERIIAYKPGSNEEKDALIDEYGNRGEQSIVGIYFSPNQKSSLRYLQDGRIVSIRKKDRDSIIIKIPDSLREYEIESQKTRKIDVKDGIKKVIVIDLKNQNQGIFWKRGEVWELISYTLITSGKNDNKSSYETPKGYFLVGNTVKQVIFPYEEKIKKENLGGEVVENLIEQGPMKEYNEEDYEIVKKYSRANYGIRFSGGGYIHGIPLSDDIVEELGSEKAVKNRKRRAAITLGTYKRSHKCVRSPEEHESFLYHDFVGYKPEYKGKWWRVPKENVAVIVF